MCPVLCFVRWVGIGRRCWDTKERRRGNPLERRREERARTWKAWERKMSASPLYATVCEEQKTTVNTCYALKNSLIPATWLIPTLSPPHPAHRGRLPAAVTRAEFCNGRGVKRCSPNPAPWLQIIECRARRVVPAHSARGGRRLGEAPFFCLIGCRVHVKRGIRSTYIHDTFAVWLCQTECESFPRLRVGLACQFSHSGVRDICFVVSCVLSCPPVRCCQRSTEGVVARRRTNAVRQERK